MYLIIFNNHVFYNIFLLMKRPSLSIKKYKKSVSVRKKNKTLNKKTMKKKGNRVNLCETGPPISFFY